MYAKNNKINLYNNIMKYINKQINNPNINVISPNLHTFLFFNYIMKYINKQRNTPNI